MLRKELEEVLKYSLFYIGIVAGVSLVLKIVFPKSVGSYFEVFFLMYQYSLLLFSGFMGISLFLPDKKQRAEDYVLSLPFSRLQVLGIKLLPRLAAVVIFYYLFVLLCQGGGQALITDHGFITISWFYWLLFVISVSFSASADGYMKVGGAALLGLLLFLLLSYSVPYLVILLRGGDARVYMNFFSFVANAFSYNLTPLLLVWISLLLLPYIISFVLALKKWGTYSKENYNKRYFKLFIPLMAAGFILSTLLMYTQMVVRYQQYYLTANHQVIETDDFSTRMFGADGAVKLEYSQAYFRPFFEDERYVYGTHMTRKSVFIVRIHKKNHTMETLRKGPRPGNLYYKYHIRVFQHMIVVPEDYFDPDNRAFVFIDTRSKTIKKMYTAEVLPIGYFEPVIFGADVDPNSGKIFWLIRSGHLLKYPIIKLWEDGKVENLGMTRRSPLYINRMLITLRHKALVFSKVTGDGLEVIHKSQNICTWHRLYNPSDLNPTSFKEIYCVAATGGGLWVHFSMNVDTFEFSRIDGFFEKPLRLIWTTSGEVYNLEYEGHNLRKIYRFEAGKFTLIKKFSPYENKKVGDNFWISNNGVVIRHSNRLSFYTFPDMKQIELPGIR